MQYPNWLLHCHIFPEGIRILAEPGNIFRRMDGTKMIEEEKKVVDSLQYEEMLQIDTDGNLIVKKVY